MTRFLNPVRTRFLISSHPIPPAPTTSKRELATDSLSALGCTETAISTRGIEMGGDNEMGVGIIKKWRKKEGRLAVVVQA